MEIEVPLRRPEYPIPKDIYHLGRSGLRQHVIAVKVRGEPWPAQFSRSIHTARYAFDLGTHIMCQGLHPDGWVIQYLIPRKLPLRNSRPYFTRTNH